ncbi:MAG: hypothetical protein Ct9H300mP19_04520 [Dehalococcoidia bacterium]|nr:MAG: hypothetical protein Ct9H300mP19_04520 [Dehalococcoidia bacterium]
MVRQKKALRAAFKTVQSGRQVGILVPQKTVLAQQHLETFSGKNSSRFLHQLTCCPDSGQIVSRKKSSRKLLTECDIVIGKASVASERYSLQGSWPCDH